MEVGDYVRTIYGIAKIEKIKQDEVHKTNWYTVDKAQYHSFLARQQEIIKSSPNIIDLIEVGDYVNGHRVNYINKDREHFNISFGDESFNLKSKFNSDIYWLSKEDIKSIVTKEQFENMSYKVGD